MKDVKYNLDPSVLLEILEKLNSDEEYGCSNLVDRPVTTVYPEFSVPRCRQNKTTHTHTTTQQDKHTTAGQPGVLVDFGSSANLLAEEMASASPTLYFALAPQLSFDPTLTPTASILKS